MLFPSTDKFHQERACGLNDVACLSVNDFDSCFFKSGAGGGFKGAAEQNSRIQLSEKCDMRGVAGGGGNLAEPVDAVFQNFKHGKFRGVPEMRCDGVFFAGDSKCAGHQSSSSSFSMVLKL